MGTTKGPGDTMGAHGPQRGPGDPNWGPKYHIRPWGHNGAQGAQWGTGTTMGPGITKGVG